MDCVNASGPAKGRSLVAVLSCSPELHQNEDLSGLFGGIWATSGYIQPTVPSCEEKKVKKPCLKKGVSLSPPRSKMCVLDVRLFFGSRFPAQVQNSRSPVLREGEGLLYEAGLCETGAGNRHRHDDGKTLHATPRWRRGAHTPALGRGRGKKRFCCTCAVKDERCRKLNVPTLSRTQLII